MPEKVKIFRFFADFSEKWFDKSQKRAILYDITKRSGIAQR